MLRRRDDFQERFDKLKTELTDAIVSGDIEPGEFILPENTLSEKYKISRVSVRKVLANLVEEGLIEKIPGKGNRVVEPKHNVRRKTLKLAWFSPSFELDIVRKILRSYVKSQPYLDVELVVLPEAEYSDSLIGMIEQGNGPDVIMMSDLIIREFAARDRLDLIHPYVPGHFRDESYPQVFELFTVNEETMATPFMFAPVVICYNEHLFRDAGVDGESVTTWESLLRVAERSTTASDEAGVVDRFGFCFSASANRWPVFVLQNGGMLLDEQGNWTLSDPSTVEALQFCVDLMYKHKVSPIYSHGSNHLAESLFVKERVAMILTTYYLMNEFREYPIAWDVRPLPQQKTASTLLLGGGLAINARSANIKAAQSFVDFMVGKTAQTLLKQNGCAIPALRSVAEDDALINPDIHPKNYNAFQEMLPHSHSLIGLGVKQDELLRVLDELHLLWANMENAEQACRRIDETMRGLMIT